MNARTVAESKPQIIVVEDDPMVGRTLCRLLTSMEVDATLVSSVNDALTHPGRFQSGFIVDYQLPDGTGIDVLEGLRREGVRGTALMYTAHASVALASAAACHGAYFCEKPASPSVFRSFVAGLLSNNAMRSEPALLEYVARRLDLTPTELEIVKLRFGGIATRKGVSYTLDVSENTVKWHIRQILVKAAKAGFADESIDALLLDAVRRLSS